VTTVLVSGAIANKHRQGGATWTRLSWLLGLKKLGLDVYFVEQIDRESCVDASGAAVSFAESENLKYFRTVVEQLGLAGSASLLYEGGEQFEGLSCPELVDVAKASLFLVNISGHLTLDAVKRRVEYKVYVDLDPGFTQFWHAAGCGWARLDDHDHYFTVGENIGTGHCSIPTGGIDWRPIRQPVVLDSWPVAPAGGPLRFTTIATWRGPYAPVEYGGRRFGLKVHEFRKFLDLPSRVDAAFEIALNIHEAEERDRQALADHGWHLVDPARAAGDPALFRQYVQESSAEFSTAQGIYVDTNSGWFSDRTVRYLASGKPALVQDTGFSRNYQTGEGLIPFRRLDEAVAGAERILSDYPAHCAAARALAEDHFDSNKVLGEFVDEVSGKRRSNIRQSRMLV
jgi:hypothetical protein